MLKRLITSVMGTRHERERKRIQPIVDEINEHYARLQSVSESELTGQTEKLRGVIRERTAEIEARIATLRDAKRTASDPAERDRIDNELSGADGRSGAEGELREATAEVLDEILPEAFATVREAARRLLGTNANVTGHEQPWDMVPYDVQLMGGIQLHLGKIAEMATGEGKTLVATLPLYLNALPGKGAHLVTVNSYLARRDSQWMGHLYRYLGLTVACLDDTEPGTPERRAAYGSDITYGTNNEFGFDYLRDNMVPSLEQRVQRGHNYAIVDEVDSVLIDEARTPLIISGPVGGESDLQYRDHNAAVSRLVRKQTELVNKLVADGERALERGDQSAAALAFYQARLGSPRNKQLLKVMQETGVKSLIQKMELDHIADRKMSASKQEFGDLEEDMLYVLDERGHSVHLTDRGADFMSPDDPNAFILPDISDAVHRLERDTGLSAADRLQRKREIELEYATKSETLNIVHQLLRAHALYEKDVNYVVQEGQVLIVDEFTGRTMPGRRWSEGLHQAVEAKEGVQVKGETQTLATVTIQNYFRMYDKLAGMTGTAETEESEFFQIYGLEVAVVPTNKPIIRDDRNDLVFKTRREKYNAIIEEAKRLNGLGFPVLIGTVSVEVSETLDRLFKREGLKPNVLNAKYHQREAEIVAEAGQKGGITIATNMAGRGTDIKLGVGVRESAPSVVKDAEGNDVEVEEIGGLHIIGSERHESRRIDRQLRGRAGRQGDPGASQFFLSLEDDLMRLFGSERIAKLMDRMGAQDGDVLTHPLITRSIEQAQKRVELQNFQSRKRLLEYDDVMNQQREVIYSLRSFALEGGEEMKGEALAMFEKALRKRVEEAVALAGEDGVWDVELLNQDLLMHYMLVVPEFADPERAPGDKAGAVDAVLVAGRRAFDEKIASVAAVGDDFLRFVMLSVLDEKWKDHLHDLDQLRNAIGYRSWGQKDPLVEYKQEAYSMFVDLMADIYHTFTERFLKMQIVYQDAPPQQPPEPPRPTKRYDAMGVLRDIDDVDEAKGADETRDIGPSEPPAPGLVTRQDPLVAGSGKTRPLSSLGTGMTGATDGNGTGNGTGSGAGTNWESVGRNDPCPCGSGKKFKKCHGARV